MIDDDDTQLLVSVAPDAGAPFPSTVVVSLWATDDETAPADVPSSLANYVSLGSPPQGWSWNIPSKPWSLDAVAQFTEVGASLPLPPISRIALPPTTHEVHVWAIGHIARLLPPMAKA
ncbi:MAG: hypothetical protein HY814_13825 [Candidatus Riflebacteria bacterium]|nr:hypothetical protein [Candidatus Riflebacteria bacterium]